MKKTLLKGPAGLLEEYRRKMQWITSQLYLLRKKRTNGKKENENLLNFRKESLVQLLNSLRLPSTKLAQFVSQQIEHAKLEELDRVELRLRLAEFESSFKSAQKSLTL